MALTADEVQEALATLKAVLNDVGPVVSKALTKLVLQSRRKPPARKEVLKFLALQLAAAQDGDEADEEQLIKAAPAAGLESEEPAAGTVQAPEEQPAADAVVPTAAGETQHDALSGEIPATALLPAAEAVVARPATAAAVVEEAAAEVEQLVEMEHTAAEQEQSACNHTQPAAHDCTPLDGAVEQLADDGAALGVALEQYAAVSPRVVQPAPAAVEVEGAVEAEAAAEEEADDAEFGGAMASAPALVVEEPAEETPAIAAVAEMEAPAPAPVELEEADFETVEAHQEEEEDEVAGAAEAETASA